MGVKEFLRSVRRERLEIERMAERIQEKESALLPAAIRYDIDRVQSTPSDPMFEVVADIERYKKTLLKRYRRLIQRKEKAARMIDTLEDSRHRQVLQLYILDGLSMVGAADKMGYTDRAAYMFYAEALRILSVNFSNTI